jgi:pimeloyl-ACP methyl ester carboxylesterase
VQGAGHHIPHEKPEELAEIVVPFLMGINNN